MALLRHRDLDGLPAVFGKMDLTSPSLHWQTPYGSSQGLPKTLPTAKPLYGMSPGSPSYILRISPSGSPHWSSMSSATSSPRRAIEAINSVLGEAVGGLGLGLPLAPMEMHPSFESVHKIAYDLRVPLQHAFLWCMDHFLFTNVTSHETTNLGALDCIVHRGLPWSTILSSDSRTVGDVLHQVHDTLQRQITHEEWQQLTTEEKELVSRAYARRCRGRPDLLSKGVRRVDFLQKRVIVEGLWWEGSWILRTRMPTMAESSAYMNVFSDRLLDQHQ